MELTRRDDAQSFLYFMFKIASSSTEPVSVGAVVKTVDQKNVWVWVCGAVERSSNSV